MDNINLNPQQIEQMILMLQSMLPKQNEPQDKQETRQPKERRTRKSKTKNENKKSTPIRENKFDMMMESRMHKEDIAIDKKLSIMPPVPRARPFELVTATCRVCGKKEQVNPVLITTDTIDRYKCNKCSTGAG